MTIDGASFANIMDLAKALDTMNDDVFYYHVTDWKNDFSNWVRDVFEEAELAEKLMEAKNKEQHQIILLKYLLGF